MQNLKRSSGFLKRNYGRPKTDAERRATHKRLYGGNTKLPPRGTGLARMEVLRKLKNK